MQLDTPSQIHLPLPSLAPARLIPIPLKTNNNLISPLNTRSLVPIIQNRPVTHIIVVMRRTLHDLRNIPTRRFAELGFAQPIAAFRPGVVAVGDAGGGGAEEALPKGSVGRDAGCYDGGEEFG